MTTPFKTIGLFAKYNSNKVAHTLENIIEFLKKRNHTLIIEKLSAQLVSKHDCEEVDYKNLGKNCDLVIVVGGDGSFLNAARVVVGYEVPMLGVNRGRLGFLTDILPDNIQLELDPILEGNFSKESRMLLTANVIREGQVIAENDALNDVVLYSGTLARMVDFDISINGHLVSSQSSDGLIASTPTGSTAYALSGGGPILYPTLHAIVLVPMLPHTLSSRPIVIGDQCQISLSVAANNTVFPKISCDGQWHFDLNPGDTIEIRKHSKELVLIHPKGYDYFSVLREKLGWHTKSPSKEC